MNVKYKVFDSGLTVIADKMDVQSSSIGVWINAGSAKEELNECGIAHMLEHMAFKGTLNRNAEQIAREIEDVGGDINAYTGKEVTAYYLKVLQEDSDLGIDILSDIIKNSVLPEEEIDFDKECERLNKVMDKHDCVNVFLSEGAGTDVIIRETEKNGETVLRDAFGHVRLDDLNPGQWFAKQLGKRLNANKVLVQKSGYFGRSSKANQADLDLIFEVADHAVQSALNGKNGVVGWDEDNNNTLSCIDFSRIKGGKPFDTTLDWYKDMIDEIRAI